MVAVTLRFFLYNWLLHGGKQAPYNPTSKPYEGYDRQER